MPSIFIQPLELSAQQFASASAYSLAVTKEVLFATSTALSVITKSSGQYPFGRWVNTILSLVLTTPRVVGLPSNVALTYTVFLPSLPCVMFALVLVANKYSVPATGKSCVKL